jgi:hypothetical protein
MQGETIICVAPRAWNSLWRSSQQYMSRIARQNRVLYFEPGRNPEEPAGAELYRNAAHFFSQRARVVHDNLIVVPTPSSIPYARQRLPRELLELSVPATAWFNAAILARQIRWAIREFKVADPILWLYEPRHLSLAGRFNEKLVVFFIHDEYADLPQNRRIQHIVQRYDTALTRRADVVFGCSPWIVNRRKQFNPNTYCVLNSGDFGLFRRALDPSTPIPADVAGLKRPIVGVVGGLDNRIDTVLLRRVAQAYPDSSIVLVGPDGLPTDQNTAALKAMPNVVFVGKKPLDALPGYVKALDVALIPYELREDTLPIYPLKLHEYLAGGRAVVSTALPEIRRHQPLVRVAETSDEFVQMIGPAAADYHRIEVQARVSVAQENTWDHRLTEIYAVLDRHLATRSRAPGAGLGVSVSA